jgi:hypothetical protein
MIYESTEDVDGSEGATLKIQRSGRGLHQDWGRGGGGRVVGVN